jgi:hypothetical protein
MVRLEGHEGVGVNEAGSSVPMLVLKGGEELLRHSADLGKRHRL